MKKEEENKTYNSIFEFNEEYFVEPSEKSTQLIEKNDDESYGNVLAVELLAELREKIK